MKKVVFLVITIVIVVIGYVVYNNIKKEESILKDNSQIIETNYNELTNNINNYNDIRKELNTKITNFIYDKFLNEKASYEEVLTKYNEVITKIDNNVDKINSKCNVLYKNIDINKICNSYKTIYEKLINIYVNDLLTYNQKVTGYNEYKSANIEKYPMIHNDYIDYDNNSIYEGKSSNEEVQE